MDPYEELRHLDLAGLIARFQEPCPLGEEESPTWFGEVGYWIGDQGEPGIDFLLSQLPGADESHLRGILSGVSAARADHPNVVAVLLAHLDDERDMVVMDAVYGLYRVGDESVRARIEALAAHRSQYVVSAVHTYLAKLFPEESRDLMIAALDDPGANVRMNAIDQLDEMDEPDAEELVPRIRAMLADPYWGTRQSAHTFLDHWWWDGLADEPRDLLTSPSPEIRANALVILAGRERSGALPDLLAALDDAEPVVRLAVLDLGSHYLFLPENMRKAITARAADFVNDLSPNVANAARYAMRDEGRPADGETVQS